MVGKEIKHRQIFNFQYCVSEAMELNRNFRIHVYISVYFSFKKVHRQLMLLFG